MNTILLEKSDFITPDTVQLTGHRLEHMLKVLKCTPGSCCKVGLLDDKLGKGEVLSIDKDTAVLKVILDSLPPPPTDIILACAMQRPQTYKKVLHTAITMGVKKLVFFGSFKAGTVCNGYVFIKNNAFKAYILANFCALHNNTILDFSAL